MTIQDLISLVKRDAPHHGHDVTIGLDEFQVMEVFLYTDEGEFHYLVENAGTFLDQVMGEKDDYDDVVDAFWSILNDHYRL